MESQRTFDRYGDELTAATAALVNFERDRRKEIDALVDEHDQLLRKAEVLEGRLAQERADLDRRLSAFYQELSTREARATSDLRAELERRALAERGRRQEVPEDALEREVVAALEKPARGILALRGRALGIVGLERELAGLRLRACEVAEMPFRMRQRAALDFFHSLVGVAQVAVQYAQGGASLGETQRWSDEAKRLDARLGIASGELASFAPLGYSARTADAVLEFALQIPEEDFPQVLNAWRSVKLGGGRGAQLVFSQNRSLRWKFKRSRVADQPRIVSISDFGSGSDDRQRASRRAARARA